MRIGGRLLLAAVLVGSTAAAAVETASPNERRRLYGSVAKEEDDGDSKPKTNDEHHFMFNRNAPAKPATETKGSAWKGSDAPKKRLGSKPSSKPADKKRTSGGEKKKKGDWKGSSGAKPTTREGGDGWSKPTDKPTSKPTPKPTWGSTPKPTRKPTRKPTWSPSKKPTDDPTLSPTLDPTLAPTKWKGDAWGGSKDRIWSGDGYDKCKPYERDVCCSQDDDVSHDDKVDVCDKLGCNLKKCGKRTDWSGDEWGSPTLDPTLSPTEKKWDGDAHSEDEEKCKQAERDACCSQPDGRSYKRKANICDKMGCNLKKCGKRSDGDEWSGDEWGSPTLEPTESPVEKWSGDEWGSPTLEPTESPVEKWSSDGFEPRISEWSGDGSDDDDKCTQADREACCDQDADEFSYVDRKEVCDDLGCNIKKCGTRNGNGAKPSSWSGDSWESPTLAPTDSPVEKWSGDEWASTPKPSWKPSKKPSKSPTKKPTNKPTKKPTQKPSKKPTVSPTDWSGDSWDAPTLAPTDKKWTGDAHDDNKCTADDRQTCCAAPYEDQEEVCDLLGCNYKKCGKRGDDDDDKKPTEKPTKMPTKKPTGGGYGSKPTSKPTKKPTGGGYGSKPSGGGDSYFDGFGDMFDEDGGELKKTTVKKCNKVKDPKYPKVCVEECTYFTRYTKNGELKKEDVKTTSKKCEESEETDER